jgi:predicted DsbA family dithiol-disulfide isomerase
MRVASKSGKSSLRRKRSVKEAEGLFGQHRVDGVPFFIINGKITLGGAQPPEAFLEAFGKAVAGK